MRCFQIFMRPLLISSFLGIGSGALNVLAQTPVGTDTIRPITGITIPTSAFRPVSVWSVPKGGSHPRFLKNLTIESFGYGLAPQAPGFQFSPGYTAALYNLQGLECPGCVVGPVNRARFTLPPFGSKVTLKLRDDRVELFGGFAALEAWKPDNTLEPRGRSLGTSSYGDAWLTQVEAGGRVAVERSQHLWLGATGRHLVNFGSGKKEWNTFSGGATLEFGHR
jgi:hypothetical protein